MAKEFAEKIASMIDISCVRSYMDRKDIEKMADAAMEFSFVCAHVLPSNVPYLKSLLKGNGVVKVGSPVGFPSGGTLTEIKVREMEALVGLGCDEIDIVINISWLKSGLYKEAEDELKQIIKAAGSIPTKVILETAILTKDEIMAGAKIALNAGAQFAKTGTGWVQGATTYEHIAAIKEAVGENMQIKASGGIRSLETLMKMYRMGVIRFGVGYEPSIEIMDECMALGEGINIENYGA